eukprot:2235666-Amphidinium_carterae.1
MQGEESLDAWLSFSGAKIASWNNLQRNKGTKRHDEIRGVTVCRRGGRIRTKCSITALFLQAFGTSTLNAIGY